MLKKLSIEHYKGFYDEQSLNFAIPQNGLEGSGLSLIIGPNNTGKTTVIESLLLNTNKKFKETERHKELSPKITIESTQGKSIYTNINNGSQIKLDENSKPHAVTFELVPSRRYWNTYSGADWTSDQFIDNTTQQQVRNADIVETGAVLKGINRDPLKKKAFNNYLKKVIPHFTDWTIDSNDQGDYVKYMTATASHQTNLLGDGVISIFRICAHLVADARNRVLIIDEPELSLHPTAQKSLSRIISLACKDRQIILCTHSPHFANWSDLINGAKFIRLNKPNDTMCMVSSLINNAGYLKFISNNYLEYQKPQLLDYVAKEILFSENILFVEGQEDVGIIRKWLSTNNIDPNFEIFGYGVASYSNIKLFLEMAKDLGLSKVAALYDNGSQVQATFEDDKKNYPDYRLEILPTDDIRDKFNDEGKQIKEGCFDKNGNLKSNKEADFTNIMRKILSYFETT